MSTFTMPVRWNSYDMTEIDILHKNLQMNFMWSDFYINNGNMVMFNQCQTDINNIRLAIKSIKEKQQSKNNNKQFNKNKQFKNK
jgi:hypothetical protein